MQNQDDSDEYLDGREQRRSKSASGSEGSSSESDGEQWAEPKRSRDRTSTQVFKVSSYGDQGQEGQSMPLSKAQMNEK